jgi:DNA-binding SARP family transcriptional activator
MKESRDENDAVGSSPAFRVWLCGAFRVERYANEHYETIRTAEWGGSNYPRFLLKALLCCPGRQARREALLDMLWPEAELEQAAQYLNTATTKLRNVLRSAKEQRSLLLTENDSTIYRLEDQSVLWIDVDEALALLKEAEVLGRTSPESLHRLERAANYFNKGTLLQDEEGLWVAGRRATVERARYRCRLWLADYYEQQDMPGQAETILNALLEEDPFDEDILCRLMNLLHQQRMTHQALKLYSHICDVFTREGLQPAEATRSLAAQLQEKRHYPLQISADLVPSYATMPLLKQVNPESTLLSQLTMAVSRGIIVAARELSKEGISTPFTTEVHKLRRSASPDILTYKRNIRLGLDLHRTSTAQSLLQDVNADIQDLGQLECQARGHDLYCIKEMLIANNLLATKIIKDQRQYEYAYIYANTAVRVAKSLEDGNLIATTKYTRGCVKLEWAQFGTAKQGILQLDKEKVWEAIRDFQEILDMAHSQRTPLHPQLQGFTCLQLGHAYSLLRDTWNRSAEVNPLTYVDQVENMVGCDSIEDAYMRLVITGTLSGLHWGAYHLNKTEIFIAMGMQDQALLELKLLRQLTERTYAQDETRNQAWGNVVMAEVMMRMEAYPEATHALRSALLACRSINSIQNTATVIDVHSRLAISSYGKSADVQEIGTMLKEWYEK